MSCMRPCYCQSRGCNTLINNDEGGYCMPCWDRLEKEPKPNHKKLLKKNPDYWNDRGTGQLTFNDLKKLRDDKLIDDDAPIVFKDVIGYQAEDYFLTWETYVDEDTQQIIVTLQPSHYHYGKKAKGIEERLDDKYIDHYWVKKPKGAKGD